MPSAKASTTSSRLWFWFHFLLVVLAWTGPFLFDWYLMVTAYGLVLLQFVVFNRCLVNAKHDLVEQDTDNTFYAELLESAGIHLPKKPLKYFVRTWLYVILGAIAFLIQVYGQYTPPLALSFGK